MAFFRLAVYRNGYARKSGFEGAADAPDSVFFMKSNALHRLPADGNIHDIPLEIHQIIIHVQRQIQTFFSLPFHCGKRFLAQMDVELEIPTAASRVPPGIPVIVRVHINAGCGVALLDKIL